MYFTILLTLWINKISLVPKTRYRTLRELKIDKQTLNEKKNKEKLISNTVNNMEDKT